jgi:hypothetical protein
MGRNRLTTDKFIEKARKVHGNKYNYSLVDYVDMHTKVHIKCPKHGVFEILPYAHTNLNTGCYKCGLNKAAKSRKMKFGDFNEKARKIHNGFYKIIKSSYKNSQSKITIICPIHGKFQQIAYNHLRGFGCKKCAMTVRSKNKLKP